MPRRFRIRSDTKLIHRPTTPSSGGGGVAVISSGPTLTGCLPTGGTIDGGTAVTLTGTNLTGTTGFTVGGAAATSVSVVNSTTVTGVTPSRTAGLKDIIITTGQGTATLQNGFTYLGAPTIDAIDPESGTISGGTLLTITGTNFLDGDTQVTVGGVACTGEDVVSDTEMTCFTPSGSAGAQDVVVTTSSGDDTLTNGFTYFGTGAIFTEDWETGDKTHTEGGFSWTTVNGTPNVQTTVKHAGTYSLRFPYTVAAPSQEQRFAMPELQEFWLQYYIFIPANYAHTNPGGSNNNKWFDVTDTFTEGPSGYLVRALMEDRPGDGSGASPSRACTRPMWGTNATRGGVASETNGMATPQGLVRDEDKGNWVQFRYHIKAADTAAASNGIYQFWKNGTLMIDETGLDNGPMTGSNVGYKVGYLMGSTNADFAEDTFFYIDDITLYSTDPGW